MTCVVHSTPVAALHRPYFSFSGGRSATVIHLILLLWVTEPMAPGQGLGDISITRPPATFGPGTTPIPSSDAKPPTMEALRQALCGNCHVAPDPSVIAKEFWPKLFTEMKGFMKLRQMPVNAPAMETLLADYVAHSPVGMKALPDDFLPSKIPFHKQSVGWAQESERPMITHINVTDLDQDGRPDAIICENFEGRPGRVSWLRYLAGQWQETLIALIEAPVKATVFDCDGDKDLDVVIAGMGIMSPNEALIGAGILLVNDGHQKFTPQYLIRNVPRITDILPADIDGDGDFDYVVAMFGWRTTGQLGWLETKADGSRELHTLMQINGAMRLAPVPFNTDGRPDFFCLFTQQHEMLGGFLNEGGGKFAFRAFDRAPTPSWGSSGFELSDLDQDGDMDVILSNGDVMDTDGQPKSYHGVRWLENTGNFSQMIPHQVLSYHNCYRALPCDVDQDGDLDIIASNLYYHWDVHDMPSLIWLENDGAMHFKKQRIAYSPTNIATFDVADFDGDGNMDILTGGMHVAGPLGRQHRLTVWMGGGTATDDQDKPRPAPGTELNKIILLPAEGSPGKKEP